MKRLMPFACGCLASLALACGSGESVPPQVDAGQPATPERTGATPVPSPPAAEKDVVQECLELAERLEWEAALEPCTAAAKQLPDDLRIEHALQQAQAAAADAAKAATDAAKSLTN